MAKDTYYFTHDYGARNDPKLIKLKMKLGFEGKGIYWDIIEMLYEQNGYLKLSECETYAFALGTDCDKVLSVIKDFDLFIIDTDLFYSQSVLNRLARRLEKSIKASKSAHIRWNEANAMQTHSEGNAIKERKGKENKGKEIKEIKNKFAPPTLEELKSYFSEKSILGDEPEKFFDFYESKGWFVGKNKMKDWRAAVRNWIKGMGKFQKEGKIKITNNQVYEAERY